MRQIFILTFLVAHFASTAQTFFSDPFAHTFSIVARDSVTGDMGAAVQSHWFSVGSLVTWGEAGVGVIATQSFVNPSFGAKGLELLKQGLSPEQVVKKLIDEDDGRDVRQLAIVDSQGRSATWTGKNCIPEAGHVNGKNFSAQANMMLNNTVWSAMAKAFKTTSGPLAERLMAALEAAQLEGGDIRGKQSAAILVVKAKSTGKIWEDRYIDLRVEDNPDPLVELKRLLKVFRAYEHMNNGDVAVEKGDMKKALLEYSEADKTYSANVEIKYWRAVTLVNNGKVEEALPVFKEVFQKNINLLTLTKRLPGVGLLNTDAKTLELIYSVISK